MSKSQRKPVSRPAGVPACISKARARAIWLRAQRLDVPTPFGSGASAVRAAIEHLGYVQIDTINVIERCHHHILFNRIPDYTLADLDQALSVDKSVFEYWTHALSLVPVRDFAHFVAVMKRNRKQPEGWSARVSPNELRKILRRVADQGALCISDIKDDIPVEKDHAWASRKPSKRALQAGFYNGQLTIAKREGMLKTYELTERHFEWEKLPKAASESQTKTYLLERALRAQGLVTLDSICYLRPKEKTALSKLLDKQQRAKKLTRVVIEGADEIVYWTHPETLEMTVEPSTQIHILSPFDPLIIQRKRTEAFFDYAHLFEAYVPKAKRKLGYFTLPVLIGDEIVAALDLKTDRQNQKMLIQSWHWVGNGKAANHKAKIDAALDRFERFQLGN